MLEKPYYHYTVAGIYFCNSKDCDLAKGLRKYKWGELEITDLNRRYLFEAELPIELMGSGYAWLDAGSHENMFEAHRFVQLIENRQGLKMACSQEIASRKNGTAPVKWMSLRCSRVKKSIANT